MWQPTEEKALTKNSKTGLETAGSYRICHQHGNGHAPDPARHRSDRLTFPGHGIKINIANEPRSGFCRRIVDAINTDINDHRPLFDMIRADKMGYPDRGDEDVRLPCQRSKIFCPGVGHGDSGIRPLALPQQEKREAFSNEEAPTDDDTCFPSVSIPLSISIR